MDKKEYMKEYYKKNKDKIIERAKEWKKNNLDKVAEITKKVNKSEKANTVQHNKNVIFAGGIEDRRR